jgi:hypothetical protein
MSGQDLTNQAADLASGPIQQFRSDPEPQAFYYASPSEIPRLPGPMIEPEFYKQWRYVDRIRGLPLVENTDFLVAHNQDDGNCYWGAIAHLTYGLGRYWPWVKAQHLLYLEQVMDNLQHPRFTTYQQIIADCSRGTQAPYSAQTALGKANQFTVVEVTQVTADLYNIYLVLFNMDYVSKRPAAGRLPFITRGSRNAPHKFMRWTTRLHYEPMRPSVPRPSEFHFPDVTYESTRHLPSSPARPSHTGVRHGWRFDYGNSDREVIEQLHPRPIIPLPSEAHIATAIGANPHGPKQSFSTEPGYLPPLDRTNIELANVNIPTILAQSRHVYTTLRTEQLLFELRTHGIPASLGLSKDQMVESLVTAHNRAFNVAIIEGQPKTPIRRNTRLSTQQKPRLPNKLELAAKPALASKTILTGMPTPAKTLGAIAINSDDGDESGTTKPSGHSTPLLTAENPKLKLTKKANSMPKANYAVTPTPARKLKPAKIPEVIELISEEDGGDEPKLTKTPEFIEIISDEDEGNNKLTAPLPASTCHKAEGQRRPRKRQRG